MSYVFIDDSVHDQAGFVMAAAVFCKIDPSDKINLILLEQGFNPSNDEFKSGTNFQKFPRMAVLRERLNAVVNEFCRFGLIITNVSRRKDLGVDCLAAIKQFIAVNNITGEVNVYFDQGFFTSEAAARKAVNGGDHFNCKFHFEQNSKVIRGIQLADLVAHIASIALKEQMGIVNKIVKIGPDSGFDPEIDSELGLLLWASIRFAIFHNKYNKATDHPIRDMTFNADPYGLYISPDSGTDLKEYAKCAFASVYLGCMH